MDNTITLKKYILNFNEWVPLSLECKFLKNANNVILYNNDLSIKGIGYY